MGTSALRGLQSRDVQAISVAGSANVTLSIDQAKCGRLKFTGLMTGDITVFFPVATPDDAGTEWECFNACTGAHTLSVAAPSGGGYIVSQGRRTVVLYDGTNFLPADTGLLRHDSCIVSGITTDVTLSEAQWRCFIITLQGSPGGGFNVIVPNGVACYIIANQTGQTATVKTAAGNGAGVIASAVKLLYIDSGGNTNVPG